MSISFMSRAKWYSIEIGSKEVVVKCPNCHADDVCVSKTRPLHLLSFVFVILKCDRCSASFMLPDVEAIKDQKPKKQRTSSPSRHAV